ncbi:MAG: hypothetical protein DHS20C10_13390 [marine bacterium B5-7]|nr:MAG: hypothetical protein DHS20C10_13390 [marine bacterium B5-7]
MTIPHAVRGWDECLNSAAFHQQFSRTAHLYKTDLLVREAFEASVELFFARLTKIAQLTMNHKTIRAHIMGCLMEACSVIPLWTSELLQHEWRYSEGVVLN